MNIYLDLASTPKMKLCKRHARYATLELESTPIIGMDVSITGTGMAWGLPGGVNTTLVPTVPVSKTAFPEFDLQYRLSLIIDVFTSVLHSLEDKPLVVFESYSYDSVGKAKIQLGEVCGSLKHVCYSRNIPFIVVAPTTLKKFISGKGNATKEDMFTATSKRYGVVLDDDNICDAFGLYKVGRALLAYCDKQLSLLGEKLTAEQLEVCETLSYYSVEVT